ncbi:MAG: response regulator transcription factor [Dehalococcoidia bacterium]
MSSPRILVAEDDPYIQRFLKGLVDAEGWRYLGASDGGEAWAIFEREGESIDVVVTDMRMPGISGIELCRRIRAVSDVALIAISALDSEDEIVAGLEAGADDYVTKPLSSAVMSAKLRGALRRADRNQPHQSEQTIGPFVLDPDARTVAKDGELLNLTPTEYGIMAYVMANAGMILTPAQILGAVWGPEYEGEAQILRVALLRLRRKIEDDASKPRYLTTHIGMGYRFARLPAAGVRSYSI